jgi:hypothetical protein
MIRGFSIPIIEGSSSFTPNALRWDGPIILMADIIAEVTPDYQIWYVKISSLFISIPGALMIPLTLSSSKIELSPINIQRLCH